MNDEAREPPAMDLGSMTLLATGTRLQEFEITGVVGEGGFGIVYEATDTLLDRRVAIKEYMPSQLAARIGRQTVRVRAAEFADPFTAGLKSFINEARMLAQFKHPALVEVFRFWEENGTAYMVMPLYDGITLKDHIASQPAIANERWLRAILAPILDALEQMHGMQVYHRDIAPDNMLILRSGAPLLLDLGAARRAIGDIAQAMTVIVKPGYAPIEQYAEEPGVPQGPWTDIYALAALIHFAITQRAPPAAVSRLLKDPLKPLATTAPAGFSLAFLGAVDRALSLQPENRPQSIQAFREQLGMASPSMAVSSDALGFSALGSPVNCTQAESGEGRQQSGSSVDPTGVRAPQRVTQPGPLAFEDLDKTLPPPLAPAASAASKAAPDESRLPIPAPSRAVQAHAAHKTASGPRATKAPFAAALAIGATALVLGGAGAFWWLNKSDPNGPSGSAALPAEAKPGPGPAPSGTPVGDVTAASASTPAQGGPVPPASPSPTVPAQGAPVEPVTQAVPAATPGAPAAASASASTQPPGAPAVGAYGSPTPQGPASDAAPKTAAPQEKTGTLRLSVRPWAEIYVDGNARGISPPIKRLTLLPGTYQVELRNPAGAPFIRQIEIRINQSIDIDHQFQ